MVMTDKTGMTYIDSFHLINILVYIMEKKNIFC
jgi:hypothetical protein